MHDRRIEQLVMRVPGVDADTGRVIAAAVARRLADRLGTSRDRGAPETWPANLDLAVRVAPNTAPGELADAIADAIVRAVGGGG